MNTKTLAREFRQLEAGLPTRTRARFRLRAMIHGKDLGRLSCDAETRAELESYLRSLLWWRLEFMRQHHALGDSFALAQWNEVRSAVERLRVLATTLRTFCTQERMDFGEKIENVGIPGLRWRTAEPGTLSKAAEIYRTEVETTMFGRPLSAPVETPIERYEREGRKAVAEDLAEAPAMRALFRRLVEAGALKPTPEIEDFIAEGDSSGMSSTPQREAAQCS
jgi:hypothetical protein